MASPAISVDSVSKRFHRGGHAELLRERIGRLWRGESKADNGRSFWSLRDVSFEVASGEAFGVIGPNGAGKSTLLKLLAGILRPNKGRVDMTRPVSALIELGAGFHGDLTGRENIYLNASILGLSRRDVRSRFDEIVEFAGIGDALEMPVKWYSSGMHARLGFSIAVHVRPRVLLVDEVLSVGDRAFRARCMEKMNAFLREGVAVVFVSHDVSSVQRFCRRAIVLRSGGVDFIGPAAEAVWRYHDACIGALPATTFDGRLPVRVSTPRAFDEAGREPIRWRPGDAMRLRFEAEYAIDMKAPSYGLSLIRMDDHMTLFESSSSRMGVETPPARAGDRHEITFDLKLNVPPGQYAIGLHVREADGVHYATHDLTALRINVAGLAQAGALVHLDPRIHVRHGRDAEARAAEIREPALLDV